MKKLILTFVLIGCGDNIVIPPDAPSTHPVEVGDEPPLEPIRPDAGCPDAPTPPLPVCTTDKHLEINGHEHKCVHLQQPR